jgi:small subunit ribosomal protein S17
MENTEQSQQDLKNKERGLRKVREGLVTSNKMDKTVVVAVTYQQKHAQYKKYIKRTKKYVAHDEENTCQVGDRVRIIESRPLSKRKRWRLQTVVERAL